MAGYKRVSEMTLEEKREKVAGFNVMDDVIKRYIGLSNDMVGL